MLPRKSPPKPPSRALLLMPILVALLSGCASQDIVATVEPACKLLCPVTVSKNDRLTDQTASQIEGNNAARDSMCKIECDAQKMRQTSRPTGAV